MLQLITDLHPIRSGVVCGGLDACMLRLKQDLPFVIHEWPSGQECNGWIVPKKWMAEKAYIWKQCGNGECELIYDGNRHPLGVIAYSQPFIAGIGGAELKKHLFFSDKFPKELIYHCDLLYKPHLKEWGFSVPRELYDSIDDRGAYHVELRTTFEPGTMKVAEYVLPGKSPESITLLAHICHPGCSNDDLSGVAVGIEVMRKLANQEKLRYTYRLLVVPEHYGSIFFMDRFGKNNMKWALFLESLGTTGPLALQRSFQGDSLIDRALLNSLKYSKSEWRTEAFRKIVGNDETCVDAAGYDIPCPSLSRVPFDEYHTSLDCPSLMNEKSLNVAADVVSEALLMLDKEMVAHRKFTGLVCLSNPKNDLYQPYFDPSIPDRRQISEEAMNWNYLMNSIPRYFDNETLVLDIAERHNLPFWHVHDYILAWESKGLVKTTQVYPPVNHKPKKLEPK